VDYSLNEQQRAIVAAAERICEKYGLDYWLERELKGGFPEEYFQEVARGGWLGIAMPEEFGGAGLGITEAALFLRTVAAGGGALAAASAIHMNIFGLHPVVLFGTQEQKERILPPFTRGEVKACFAVTEPDTGLNTTQLKVKAERVGDHYILSGKKVWISTAQVADYMLILARTTPLDQVTKKTHGLSLFYTKLDRDYVQIREIEKMGRKCVDSNEMFIDNLPVPVADRIGEEGRGLEYIFPGMNAERCLVGAEAVGIGRAAIRLATQYAKDRIVFNRPIGQNQGIQHPLAQSWAELEAANHMVMAAATLLDQGEPCGSEANAAKLLASQAAMKACQTAVLTHGGFGYAKEYHVERFLREIWVPYIAPVSPQLALSNIAEKKLGLPKSY
jgi:acyl-CoA dehydrogenase